MRSLVPVSVLVLALLSLACGDTTQTAATSTPVPSTQPARTPTAAGTSFPRVDGTVDPLGFGGTEPVTVKANPDPPVGNAILKDVRAGAHPEEGGWDRVVFEFERDQPPGEISYVQSVLSCGPGLPVSVQGQAILAVRFTAAQAHNDQGQLTVRGTQVPGPGNAILEAKEYCDFEGHVDWAVGVKSRTRFKVTRLPNPTRLVIDIKW